MTLLKTANTMQKKTTTCSLLLQPTASFLLTNRSTPPQWLKGQDRGLAPPSGSGLQYQHFLNIREPVVTRWRFISDLILLKILGKQSTTSSQYWQLQVSHVWSVHVHTAPSSGFRANRAPLWDGHVFYVGQRCFWHKSNPNCSFSLKVRALLTQWPLQINTN